MMKRSGNERLNIEDPGALSAYLRAGGWVEPGETLAVEVLAGGVSNRTVYVQRSGGCDWVVKQALEKLRVEADWFSDPQRVHREAAGLRWLGALLPRGATPGFVFEDMDEHVLAMEAVPQPHENWKQVLLAGRVDREHVAAFAQMLATLHGRGYERRDEVRQEFEDRSFFENLRLEPYYTYTGEQVAEASAFMHALVEQTRSRQLTLVHGDYSPKNVLVHDNRLVLLDHEVIHWGDPAFDIGFSMAHLLSKAHHLPAHRQRFIDAAERYWQTYAEQTRSQAWSDGIERFAVSHTLACLLARTSGRSPLEYLSDAEKQRQREAVVRLMHDSSVDDMHGLIQQFVRQLSAAVPHDGTQ